MALQSDGADTSYINYASPIPSTNFWFTALFRTDVDDPSGEADLFTIAAASPFNYLSIRADVEGGTREDLRFASSGAYVTLTGTAGNTSDWFGLGIACAGTGATDLIITVKTTSTATPVTFTRLMDGGTWTPDYLRLFMGLLRGGAGSVQNLKYGTGHRSATQLQDEMYTTTNVHTAGSPLLVPMVTGDVTAQRGVLTVTGSISTTVGPLDSTGGSAPTITQTAAGVVGDKLTVTGTYTGTGGGLSVYIEDRVEPAVSQTISPAFAAGAFTATFRPTEPGPHIIRTIITDSNGTDSDDSAAQTVVAVTGTDELPYTWPVTSLAVTPSTVAVEVGATAPVTVKDQAGNLMRGATVTSSAIGSITATTDIDGKAYVTGVSAGTGQITAQVLNQSGGTVSANATLTVGTATGATVTVSPSTATIAVDQTIDFDATVVGSTAGVTWSVVSGGGSIDTNGVYTPAAAGSVTVRATSVEFGASSGDATVTVNETVEETGFVASFLSDATQSAQFGAVLVYTISVRRNNFPIAAATITCTASQSSSTLGIVDAVTDANGRGSVQLTVGDGSPVDTTVVLSFTISDGTSETVLTGYLQILSELYGSTELRGVTYARPRPRNE